MSEILDKNIFLELLGKGWSVYGDNKDVVFTGKEELVLQILIPAGKGLFSLQEERKKAKGKGLNLGLSDVEALFADGGKALEFIPDVLKDENHRFILNGTTLLAPEGSLFVVCLIFHQGVWSLACLHTTVIGNAGREEYFIVVEE